MVTAVLGLGLWAGCEVAPLPQLEWLTQDARFWARAKLGEVAPTGAVVVLGIDELTLSRDGIGKWPFQRSVHGEVLGYMGRVPAERPAVVAWDILFVDIDYEPAMDAALAAPLPGLGFPVVFGAQVDPVAAGVLSEGRVPAEWGPTRPLAEVDGALATLPDQRGGLLPLSGLLKAARFGFLTADAGSDGKVRQIPLVVRVGDEIFPSLVLETLLAYWGVGPEAVTIAPGEAVTVRTAAGVQRIPIDGAGLYHLNYRYELKSTVALAGENGGSARLRLDEAFPEGVEPVSYAGYLIRQMNRFLMEQDLPPPPVAGKIVLVGQIAAGLTDIGPSPLAGQSAKVMVHVNALENVLRGDYLRRWPLWPVLAAMLGGGLLGAWFLDRQGLRVYSVVTTGVVIVLVLATQVLLTRGNLMVPVALPLLGFFAQQAFVVTRKIREEQAQRDRIRKMFGSYVSPELVRRMVEAGDEPQLGGHEEEITAFFSDIQSFSSFSEVLTPSDLGELLNEYLGAMTDELQRHGGALDKYIGDAIVAMFGAPVAMADHARAACEAAALMQGCQARLREKWKAEGDRWPPLVHAMRTRIGLNSGRVVVGNMGSRHRFNYTMMGDPVNLAARMESGAKSFGVYTLVTEATVLAAREKGTTCVFRELDRIVVKGRSQPVAIFELTGLADDLSEDAKECLRLFAEGRAHYLRQEWDAAIAAFTAAAEHEPNQPGRDAGVENNPSLVMAGRCRVLRATPPTANWDGVYRMTTK